MDNVVPLRVVEAAQDHGVLPNAVLAHARKARLVEAAVVGIRADGEFFFASNGHARDDHFLLALAQAYILEGL